METTRKNFAVWELIDAIAKKDDGVRETCINFYAYAIGQKEVERLSGKEDLFTTFNSNFASSQEFALKILSNLKELGIPGQRLLALGMEANGMQVLYEYATTKGQKEKELSGDLSKIKR